MYYSIISLILFILLFIIKGIFLLRPKVGVSLIPIIDVAFIFVARYDTFIGGIDIRRSLVVVKRYYS
jgi:hypothetical protein